MIIQIYLSVQWYIYITFKRVIATLQIRHSYMKTWIKIQNYLSRKCIWKCGRQNVGHSILRPLLLTWINFDTNIHKSSHTQNRARWNYSSISTVVPLKFGNGFHPIYHNGYNYLSMLGVKLIHVSKRAPSLYYVKKENNTKWHILISVD